MALGVTLRISYTETGTLELWCVSRGTGHTWRLAFSLRGSEPDPAAIESDTGDGAESDSAVIDDAAVAEAIRFLRRAFAPGDDSDVAPESVTGELERILGFGKAAWPLGVIRQLADVLLETTAGRNRSPAHEGRWLNLAGFCVRPGFGATADPWRVSELRKVYAAGLAFPKDTQCQVEWIVLWQRVAAGFTAGHQRELAQRVTGQLGLGQKKAAKVNPQIEREGWRLLGSLERLDSGQRVKLGDELAERLRRDSRNGSLLWALGRFGARAPLYGPLSSIVPAAAASRWTTGILAKNPTVDGAAAIVQIAARTGDPARDLPDDTRAAIVSALRTAGIADAIVEPVEEIVPQRRADLTQAFGESLPEGLRLGGPEGG